MLKGTPTSSRGWSTCLCEIRMHQILYPTVSLFLFLSLFLYFLFSLLLLARFPWTTPLVAPKLGVKVSHYYYYYYCETSRGATAISPPPLAALRQARTRRDTNNFIAPGMDCVRIRLPLHCTARHRSDLSAQLHARCVSGRAAEEADPSYARVSSRPVEITWHVVPLYESIYWLC